LAWQRRKEEEGRKKGKGQQIELSQMWGRRRINLPFITAGASGTNPMQQKLTRMRRNSLRVNLLEAARYETSELALKNAKIVAETTFQEVVLVGGFDGIPKCSKLQVSSSWRKRVCTGREPG